MRNLAQHKCHRCRRWYYDCLNEGCVSETRFNALRKYANKTGRFWKAELQKLLAADEEPKNLKWVREVYGPDKLQIKDALRALSLDAKKHQCW